MNKMTHLKFNLNNFLFAISDPLDNTHLENKSHIKYSSKRVAYIALKIAKLNMLEEDFLSDLLSYCLIAHHDTIQNNIDKIPFNNKNNIQSDTLLDLYSLASFVEEHIKIENFFVFNRSDIIKKLETINCFDEIYKENLLYLMEFDYFWLDMANSSILPFKILDMIGDFTQEYLYDDLIALSKIFYEIYYKYTNRTYIEDIGIKLKTMAEYYNFDQKDTARLLVSGYLSYIGYLLLDKNLCLNEEFFSKNNSAINNKLCQIRANAYFCKTVLSKIFGFDDIAKLASSFGEQIDGNGYPYKKGGNELSLKYRLFCIIYRIQALEEKRNYRKEYQKDTIFSILKEDAQKGQIDLSVLEDVESIMHT